VQDISALVENKDLSGLADSSEIYLIEKGERIGQISPCLAQA